MALFEQLDNIPEWIDLEAAERGGVAYYNVTRMAEKIAFAFGYWATTLEDCTSSTTGETQMVEINPLQRGIETANFVVNLGLHGVLIVLSRALSPLRECVSFMLKPIAA